MLAYYAIKNDRSFKRGNLSCQKSDRFEDDRTESQRAGHIFRIRWCQRYTQGNRKGPFRNRI